MPAEPEEPAIKPDRPARSLMLAGLGDRVNGLIWLSAGGSQAILLASVVFSEYSSIVRRPSGR